MKHRAISILLAVTFLLSVCLFCTVAFAATESADGIYAELKTDKAEYAKGEAIDVTLEVKNYNPRANSIRTELVLPNGVKLSTGSLVNEGAALAPNQEANFSYGLLAETPTTTTTPTTAAPTTAAPTTAVSTTAASTTVAGTTAAPTTGSGTPGGPSDTGDISLYIFGALAMFSLVGLILVAGGKKLFKQRWFVMVLCTALLLGITGPVVAFAAADKSFTVSTTITVDGTPVTLEAVVSYELVEDSDYTEQVEFKKDGQFLWNKVVEQGYFLPPEVSYNGQTTSKDGTYRPEVNAPYIDMLFGTAKKSGEFTADIFNAEADQDVLIGLTNDPASKLALELIGKDEWIVTVIDGKLVATGWYDNASAAAARALYALGSVDADDITLTLPMIGKMNYVTEAPNFTAGKFLGAMDSDFGAVIMRYNEITADDFDAYCAVLETAGYELYESNTMDGFKQTATLEFATYVKGDEAVLVQYLPVSLLDQDPATLNEAEKKAYDASFSADGDSIRVILTSTDLLGNNDDANTGWTDAGIAPKVHLVNGYDKYSDGNNIGLSEIFTLADGSFVVVDGGFHPDADNLYRTLSYMNEREDGKIVVAAWILTHAHNDHTGALGALSASKMAADITIEQIVLNHVAKSYRWRTEYDPYGYAAGFSPEFDNIKSIVGKFAQGEDYKLVIPHMGQIMKVRNAEIEFLTVGDEDVYPVIFNNDNGQSLVFRVTFPETTDQEFMCTGDSALDQSYNVFFPLMTGELHADILTVAHHGLGGQTSRFYPLFTDVEVAIWHTTTSTINKNDLINKSQNAGLRAFDPLDIVTEEYVQTLNIPFNKDTDPVLRTKIGTFKTKFQEGTMDITMLPAFRFQGQWAAKKDIIVDYLKKYSADVMVLPLIDQNTTTKYNKADLVNELYEALDYNYIYYAPVWGCETNANMATGDGTMGHLILSTYPILNAETGILVEGTPDASPEGRGYAHVLLDVEGVPMDLVATHFNDAGNWTKFGEMYEQWGEYTIIAGNTKIQGNPSAVGLENVSAAFDSDVTMLGSEGITFANAATNKDTATEGNDFFVNANMSAIYTATAKFSLYTAPEANEVPVSDGFANWWLNRWGGSFSTFESAIETIREQNQAVVTLQQISNNTIGATAAQVAAEAGYEYYYCVENVHVNTAGGFILNHMILSHYPIEPQDDIVLVDYNTGLEGRKFGHVIVDIDGTKTDVYFGATDWLSEKNLDDLEAAVAAVVEDTDRPFVISGNDMANEGVTSFAGVEVYNYRTEYVATVMVSKGSLDVSETETIKTPISAGGIDDLNIVYFEPTGNANTPGDPYVPPVVPEEPDDPNSIKLDVAVIPVSRFKSLFTANKETILNAIKSVDADVLAITQLDESVSNPSWWNHTDVATQIIEGVEDVYPYSYFAPAWYTVEGEDGAHGHLILSKYEIVESETIVLVEGTPYASSYTEGRASGRVLLDVEGVSVDVFFMHTGDPSEWNVLAPAIKASEADVWVAMGYMSYASIEESGIETALDEDINAAFDIKFNGSWNFNNIISSSNAAISNVVRQSATFAGYSDDPLSTATITFAKPEIVAPESVELNVAVVPVSRFGGQFAANKDAILAAIKGVNADVLAITQLDESVTNPSWWNHTDVATQIAEGVEDVFPYAYYAPAWYTVAGDNGSMGHLILSKYEIKEYETIVLVEGTPYASTYTEGRASGRVLLDVEGVSVDVFFMHTGNPSEWDVLAPAIKASEADAWIAVGYMSYASVEESGIEAKLEADINAAFGLQYSGAWNFINIISSSNAAISNAVRESTTFGSYGADPLSSATVTIANPEYTTPEPVELNVAVVPVSRFGGQFAANKDAILAAIKGVNADVLAITQLDESVTNPSWWNHTDVATQIAEGVEDVFPYAYYAPAWYTVAGDNGSMGHLILSKYEIKEYETIVLVEGTPYASTYTEGRASGRVLLDVEGVSVDVFFMHTGNPSEWDVLAPAIKASEADAWIAVGYMSYASVEESGIEAKLEADINAAFGLQYSGAWNFINIISSSNAAISNAVRESTTFGSYGADPLSSATVLVTP